MGGRPSHASVRYHLVELKSVKESEKRVSLSSPSPLHHFFPLCLHCDLVGPGDSGRPLRSYNLLWLARPIHQVLLPAAPRRLCAQVLPEVPLQSLYVCPRTRAYLQARVVALHSDYLVHQSVRISLPRGSHGVLRNDPFRVWE